MTDNYWATTKCHHFLIINCALI